MKFPRDKNPNAKAKWIFGRILGSDTDSENLIPFFEVEEMGKNKAMRVRWRPGQFDKLHEAILARRPVLKEQVNARIAEVLQIARDYDPIGLLSAISARNSFTNPETYRESTYSKREDCVEYAQSLLLSRTRDTSYKEPTSEV